MKTSSKYLIIIILIIFAFYGCEKGGSSMPDPVPDTTKPTISIIKPIAGQTFVAGNTIDFQAAFSDNVSLKSYEIAISKAVTSGLTLKFVPTSVPFNYLKSSTNFTSGDKQQEINLSDIKIPSNTVTTITTSGKYNFKVIYVDGSNNSAETTLEININ
jgi:hypothetical protein